MSFARHSHDETLVVALNIWEQLHEVKVPVGAYFHNGVALQTLLTSNGATNRAEQTVVEDGQVVLKLPVREGIVCGVS